MKSSFLCSSLGLILASSVLVLAPAAAAQAKPDNGWIPPFNGKNFDGWYSYLDSAGIRRPDPADPSRMIPLKSGWILLEAEGSEIWFRDIRIKPLGPSDNP
jgi:hypothetical protein